MTQFRLNAKRMEVRLPKQIVRSATFFSLKCASKELA